MSGIESDSKALHVAVLRVTKAPVAPDAPAVQHVATDPSVQPETVVTELGRFAALEARVAALEAKK
jgi:hypothetical protein